MSERIIFVDENDQPVGIGSRVEAWANGFYTRNVRVVLRDQSGRFLSQKRSRLKQTFPGMWTVAASGHVDEGETWDEAACRETREEIGVSPELKLVGSFTFKNDDGDKKVRQIVHVYDGVIDSSTQFKIQDDEVEAIEWYELNMLRDLMDKNPDIFTPSFRETIRQFYDTVS